MSNMKIDKTKCVSCGYCINSCPMMAISRDENGKSEIDVTKCVGCGTCASVCPMMAISAQ